LLSEWRVAAGEAGIGAPDPRRGRFAGREKSSYYAIIID